MSLLNKFCRFATKTFEIARKAMVVNVILLASFLLPASATGVFGQAGTAGAARLTRTPPVTQTTAPPKTWIDADTGHRVIRLTDEPGSEALYTGRNAFTRDGRDMVYVSPQGIHVLNLATLKTRLIFGGGVRGDVIVGTRTRRVFFMQSKTSYLDAVDIDTGRVTRLASIIIPAIAFISSVNADETLIVGKATRAAPDFAYYMTEALREAAEQLRANPANTLDKDAVKQKAMQMRLDAKVPESLFTVNLQTGEVKIILQGTDWLVHPQFSPTDPNLILYEHEGPYADTYLDRFWTIRADGSQNQVVHPRVIPGERTAHAFWSQDGKTIWYEREKPRHDDPTWSDYDLIGYDVATGNRKIFRLDQMTASTFYSAANNGAFFCGSGHRSKTAHGEHPTEGQVLWSGEWIDAYYPILNNGDSGTNPQNVSWFHFNNPTSDPDSNAQYTGWFRREKLVNMYRNDYTKLDPNVRISPDNKYVIFTSNMFGPTYVFAVQIQ